MPNWKLKSGEAVVDRYNSHLHPGVTALLPAVFAELDMAGRAFLVHEHDFGHVVGKSNCVTTGPSDTIVYAKRPKRWGYSRFVLNREPDPCSSVVVILKKATNEENTYVLLTAYVGHLAEPEPWDRNLRDEASRRKSREFWSTHALVWGSEETVPGTETARCPW